MFNDPSNTPQHNRELVGPKVSLFGKAVWMIAGILAICCFATAQDPAAIRSEKLSSLLQPLTNPPAHLRKSSEGFVDAIIAAPGDTLRGAGVSTGNAEKDALAFLSDWADLFHSPSAHVSYSHLKTKVSGGRSYVRLQQTYRSLPVYGAELMVQINPEGIVSVNSKMLRDLSSLESGAMSVTPTVGAEPARQAALTALQDKKTDLQAAVPTLMIYSPPIVGKTGNPLLVWQTIVESVNGPSVREFVLINAHKGTVALRFTLVHTAKNRQIYDSNNTTADPGTPARFEGQPASGINDVNLAYTYFGDTYDFYFNNHGRDSIDDAGMVMSATTRYCDPLYVCPFPNAYWTGTRMYFGAGFSAADDVVSHELTHGVTDYESGLIYFSQSGAINESLSDIWGEFVDLSNTGGTDTAAVRWKMGEDVPGFGAIRDMQDPPFFGDPDRMCSPLFYLGPGDNGGVHYNSGVNNKLAYLLTDGDTFNGFTITGMGITRVADLYYEAQTNLLTASTDYVGLYAVLTQAAINLGFTPAERTNIDQACQAVEINDPCPPPPPPVNDTCAAAICIADGVPLVGSTIVASLTSDISTCATGDTYDVWYRYTPQVTGPVIITTCGPTTDFDTTLAVYTACGTGQIACDDDDLDCFWYPLFTTLSPTLTAGITYRIRVSGYSGETGNFDLLVVGGSGVCLPPPNSTQHWGKYE